MNTDWRERCCEERITKPVETEQSDPHGRQGERIKDRSRPVCCSSCLLLVLFATRRTCYSSYLLLRQGFVPRALGLWLNQKAVS